MHGINFFVYASCDPINRCDTNGHTDGRVAILQMLGIQIAAMMAANLIIDLPRSASSAAIAMGAVLLVMTTLWIVENNQYDIPKAISFGGFVIDTFGGALAAIIGGAETGGMVGRANISPKHRLPLFAPTLWSHWAYWH